MAWRHRIAFVVLVALSGLPVGGAVCAMVCDSASTHAAAHHATDRECAGHSRSSAGPQMSGASAHDCTTHAAMMGQVAATAATKTGLSAKSALALVHTASPSERVTLHDRNDSFDYATSPGTVSPAVRPAVLRV